MKFMRCPRRATMRLPQMLFTWFVVISVAACSTSTPPISDPVRLGQLVLPDETQLIAPADFIYTGEGTYIFPDGTHWSGNFVAGRLHGAGREERAGTIYNGGWENGQRSGNGRLTEASGLFYDGFWFDDRREGFGSQTYPDGSRYEGEWRADRRDGFGSFISSQAGQYQGHWHQDQRQGYGTSVSRDGVVYEGMWSADQASGLGKETRPDGSVYEGQFINDRKHGEGVETHLDGTAHQGTWEEGQILGVGDRTTRAGIIFSGAWTRNVISFGLVTFPDGHEYAGHIFIHKGQGVAPDFIEWLTKSESAYARYFLAMAHLDYVEPSPDPSLAQTLLEQSAASGIADAHYRLALLLKETDATTAVSHLHNAASLAHGPANGLLGEYYHIGMYVEKSLTRAIQHYEAAVQKGAGNATNNLAWLLATTQSDYVDAPRAIELIQPLAIYTGHWQYLDTLAAAHARMSNFPMAIEILTEAVRLLKRDATDASGDVLADLESRLSLYQQDQPYLE